MGMVVMRGTPGRKQRAMGSAFAKAVAIFFYLRERPLLIRRRLRARAGVDAAGCGWAVGSP